MSRYIGMRTFKTGLTVFLAALVAQIVNPDDQFVLLFTALIALESHVASSFQIGMKRIAATVIGSLSAIFLYYSGLPLPVAAALAVMLLIIVANQMGQIGSIGVSGSVTILILLNGFAGQNPYLISLIRMRDTFIAVAIASLVNFLIFPPKPSRRIQNQENQLHDTTLALVEKMYLYGIYEDLEDYRLEIQSLAKDIHQAETEIDFVENIGDKRLVLDKKLLSHYQKVYIYSENLSLMGKEMRVTDANQKELTDLYGHEELLERIWDEEEMSAEEVIYNYILKRLISNLKEIQKIEEQIEKLNQTN